MGSCSRPYSVEFWQGRANRMHNRIRLTAGGDRRLDRGAAATVRLLADTTPLQNPNFRRLWLAGIVTVIGGQLSVVAVPQQIFEITRSSAFVGLTGVFALVPLIVFGLWGGALADVMDRRRLMI